MKNTMISWAHATVNFWTGCNHISRECEGCYAEKLLNRQGRDFKTLAITRTGWKDAYSIDEDAARRGGTAIVFTCSLSDFFHRGADRWRNDAWNVIRDCKNVRWLVLTKRPQNILEGLPSDWGKGYPNVWLGVTVGSRDSYQRLDVLRKIPCALRFISAEPLLESLADVNLDGVGWVAAGGMSGPLHKERAMNIEWAHELYKKCEAAGVPFLYKQSSHQHTERGIDGLNRFIDHVEGRGHSGSCPLIRQYPVTTPPLLPFTEHGHRFTDTSWAVQIENLNIRRENSIANQ